MAAVDDLRVLHLFGSRVSDFYFDLSRMYAEQVLGPSGTVAHYAAVAPDGTWRLGDSLDTLSDPMPMQAALRHLPTIDLMVPHMFCVPGMTSYRALFEDLLGVPVVGSDAATTALATRKTWTKDVVAAIGVTVPAGGLIAEGTVPDLPAPFIVKPNREDNSRGVSVVRDRAEAPAAVAAARRFDSEVLAEAFVPGRELRAAVVEDGDRLLVPAFIEYPTSEARPIREVADKLERADGSLRQSQRPDAQPACPAQVDPDLAARLAEAARLAHRALGARDYSLFDFRIHRETGEPHLLEAGLFWTFSDLSAITKMLRGAGHDPVALTGRIWRAAAARTTGLSMDDAA
jgi:D-alanine-D-alanine ligase